MNRRGQALLVLALAAVFSASAAEILPLAKEPNPAGLKQLETERIEWFKARTELLLTEAGLSREQLTKFHEIFMSEHRRLAQFLPEASARDLIAESNRIRSETKARLRAEFTERQLNQIRAYQTEVATRYEAWLKASGQQKPAVPLPRKGPTRHQDRPLQLAPGSG